MMKMGCNNSYPVKYQNTIPGYLENQQISLFYHTDLKDNLENIVFKEKSKNEKGILEKVFSDKSKTLKSKVKALLDEIKLRESLDSHLLSKIDNDICRQHTELMQLDNIKIRYSPDLANVINRRKLQLETDVLELEKEKRKEYLECWRDLMFLKKYLLTSLKDYWDLIKKREVLAYDFNELVKNENSKRH